MVVHELTTTSAAIDALGGTKATSEIVGTSQQAVSNCRKRTQFPAAWSWTMRTELQHRGFDAPLSLWGIKRPERAA